MIDNRFAFRYLAAVSFVRCRYLLAICLVLILTGCASKRVALVWSVRQMASTNAPLVELQSPNSQSVLQLPTRTAKELLLAHFRLSRAAKVQAELFIVDGDEPNAFAGYAESGQRIVAMNLGMIKLANDNTDELAALLGHELAHWSSGHVEASKNRTNSIRAIGRIIDLGLAIGGIPMVGYATDLGLDLIDASYNRDQEREADRLGIEYAIASGYDPNGSIRLHEKMIKQSSPITLPFLSTHPSGDERIANLRGLIAAKNNSLATSAQP